MTSNNDLFNNFYNQSMNTELLKQLKSIITSKKIDFNKIMVIFMLFGVDSIKCNINKIINNIIEQLKIICFKLFKNIKSYILKNLLTYKSNNILDLNLENSLNDDSRLDKISITKEVYNLLCEYILINKYSNCDYIETRYFVSVDHQNKNCTYNSKLQHIKIQYKTNYIHIYEYINCSYNKQSSNNKISNVEKLKASFEDSKYRDRIAYYLLQKLPIPIYEINKIYLEINKFINKNTKSKTILEYLNIYEYNSYNDILLLLFKNNDTLNKFKTISSSSNINVFECFNVLKLKPIMRDYIECFILYAFLIKIILLFEKKINDGYIMYMLKLPMNFSNDDFKDLYQLNELFDLIFINDDIINSIYDYFKKMNDKNKFINNIKSSEINYFRFPTLNMNALHYIIYDSNNNILSYNQSETIMIDFIHYLNTTNFTKKNNDGVNVYNIIIHEDIEIIKEAELPKTIKKELNDGTTEILQTQLVPAITKTNLTIEYKQINSVYKSFESLYLKEHDEFRLKSILSSFEKKKHIYQNLCIPFKFNCMLYGKPGVGKSSTIKAIGSYLNKDLYYLDLSKVKNNEDLNTIFFDINKNIQSNGIIVLEDIDCMTDIVLSRDVDNSDFTLSNLLNLLDGTMTKSDSMVIMTTNYYDKLDKALIRAGRMDLTIHLEHCNDYQYKTIYKNIINNNISEEALNKIINIEITPAQFIYGLLPYIDSSLSDVEIIDNILLNL